MNASKASSGLRRWWASPPRSGPDRLINPWEYRHLRAAGIARLAGGGVAAAAGLVCLSYDLPGWATLFLVTGALNGAGGIWYLTVAGAEPAAA